MNSSPTSSQTTPNAQASDADEQAGVAAAGQLSVVSAGNSVEQPETSTAATAAVDLPSNTSVVEASGTVVTEKLGIMERLLARVKPMTPKKLHKKIDKAWDSGALSKIRLKVIEMNAFNYNSQDEEKFDELLNEGKELLAKLASHMPLWQEDAELLDKVQYTWVMILNMKFLGEKASTDRSAVGSASYHMRLIYEKSISAILRGSPHPWDFDDIYVKIKALFNSADGGATATGAPSPEEMDFEKMVLADVPLNPNIKLPRTCCLRLFGLHSQAEEEEEIRSAYRKLCLQYHPDKNPEDPEYAKEMFLRVQIVASSLRL